MVELQDQVLPPLDPEMTTPIADSSGREGRRRCCWVNPPKAFERDADGLTVRLKSGQQLTAQLVVLGVGVRPENRWRWRRGWRSVPRGGIRVNEHLQTSDPDIYAVGDAVEVTDFVTGRADPGAAGRARESPGPHRRRPHLRAGQPLPRHAGHGHRRRVRPDGGHDRRLGEDAAPASRPYRKVYVHPAHHAGYYPGAEPMTLKLLFDPQTGRVLGAQAVGGAGVDKRIDVLAVAIQAGMTVFDLEEMELAYAPQYGSAKDPVNMAGFVAAGLLRGDHPQVGAEQLVADAPAGRSRPRSSSTSARRREFAAGHIPDARQHPVDELRSRLARVAARSAPRRLLPGRPARLPGHVRPPASRLPGDEPRRLQDLPAVRGDEEWRAGNGATSGFADTGLVPAPRTPAVLLGWPSRSARRMGSAKGGMP